MDSWFDPPTLTGSHVRLEPLTMGHAPGLFAVADPDTFKYMLWTPEPWGVEGFEEYVRRRRQDSVPFAVCLLDGIVVGSTTFLELNAPHRGIEIGFTWYGEPWRGTCVNPEAKLLLLSYAFETLGCVRVQLKTDERNARSRAGIEKLGARFEGILRHHRVLSDGHLRNTAFYSILPEEWPAVREKLVERIRNLSPLTGPGSTRKKW